METKTIEINEEIQSILDRYEIKLKKEDVTINHPNLGETVLTPDIYAVYLAVIKATYTLNFLNLIDTNKVEAMASYGYFASMIHSCDDLPYLKMTNEEQQLKQASEDCGKCTNWIIEADRYDLLD